MTEHEAQRPDAPSAGSKGDAAAARPCPAGPPRPDATFAAPLEAVCRLAAALLGMPAAMVWLRAADGFRVAAKHTAGNGSDVGPRTPSPAFLDRIAAGRAGEILVVAEEADPVGVPHAGNTSPRFQAGVPLAGPSGRVLGVLCVLDAAPRAGLDEAQGRQLRDLALVVQAQLDRKAEIAERQAVERRLQATLESQAVAERTARFGHWRIDVAEGSILWSDGIARIFGRNTALARLPLERHIGYYHPDDRERVRARIAAAALGGAGPGPGGYAHTSRVVRPDGTVRVVAVHGIAARDMQGRVAVLHGVCLDVTELSASEQSERETGELLRTTIETMDQGLISCGPDRRVRVRNRRANAILSLPDAVLREGARMEDVRRALAERGEDLDETAHAATGEGPDVPGGAPRIHEHRRPDGTILEIRTAPLACGGHVRTFTDVTQRRAAEEALRASETRLKASEARLAHALDGGSDGLWDWNLAEDEAWFSDRFYRMLGYERGELRTDSSTWARIAHPDDAARATAAMRDHLKGLTPHYECEYRLLRKDGATVWVLTRGKVVTRDAQGRALRIVGTQLDISRRKQAEDALRLSEERLALALDGGSDGLWDWTIATGTISFTGQYFRTLGYALGEIEPNIGAWGRLVHPEDAGNAMALMKEHLRGGNALYECEYRMRGKDGGYRWTLSRGRVVSRDGAGRAIRMVGIYLDVTRRKEAEQRIAYMAAHDALTGLPDRLLFRERLDQELAEARRTGLGFAVLACDHDRFKAVNDTLGHPAGDALLRAIAGRLSALMHETAPETGGVIGTVARLGGDEFAIILRRIDDPQAASLAAQRIIRVTEQPVDLDGSTACVGISIGIALGSPDCADADGLFRKADIALYGAKAAGRNAYSFYEPGMDAAVARRTALERDLREAARNGDFTLAYQPVTRILGEETCGFEALIRWPHALRGPIPPAEFIPLAEETGLIVGIGAWALREACHEAAGWPQPLRVAVNVSAVQFRRGGLEQAVVAALAASGLPAQRLELEITESVLMEDSEAALACLHRLRGLGVRIALDDFGTGYSSLSYLRRFPFDKIKIDRSFIRDIADPDTAAIVRAIVDLGESLGTGITAEGVETREQLDLVRREGCTEVQGFLFGRPCPAAEIRQLMEPVPRRAAG